MLVYIWTRLIILLVWYFIIEKFDIFKSILMTYISPILKLFHIIIAKR